MIRAALVLFSLVCWSTSKAYKFPENFRFGVATSAYQVEGAWNASGKGENIWDRLTHTKPDTITDGSTGDITCDSYSKTKEDVQLLKHLGVDFYRFSISWSRVLPSGKTDYINPDGLRYYNELIDELLANGIKPFVTMYHFDLPQKLQDEGGFLNSALVDYFADYAKVLFENFGDRVKDWITFNGPTTICYFGYASDLLPPMLNDKKKGGYLCGRTLLIAHAKTYHLYNNKYRKTQKGRVGIANINFWFEPQSTSIKDIQAAEFAQDFFFGWFMNPIYSKEGDYPQTMKGSIQYMSNHESLPTSRLPEFTQEEIEMIRGSADFLGLSHYTTYFCTPIPDEGIHPGFLYFEDVLVTCIPDVTAEVAASKWLRVLPGGFRNALKWVKDQYNNPEVIVTENGISDYGKLLHDCRRTSYYNSYLTELLKAIHIDGCNVSGYTAWSFMDNFEWRSGYIEKFGLYAVDFDDPNRPRTPKMSAYVFKNIIETRRVNWSYIPEGFGDCEWLRLKDEL